MLSCSAVVWLERDGRSWAREGKSSRSGSLSALQVCSRHRSGGERSSRDAGPWVLMLPRGAVPRSTLAGVRCAHTGFATASPRGPCCFVPGRVPRQQPLLHASRGLGSSLWGIHLYLLMQITWKCPPEWDSWSPAAFLGAFFMCPCKYPGNLFWGSPAGALAEARRQRLGG